MNNSISLCAVSLSTQPVSQEASSAHETNLVPGRKNRRGREAEAETATEERNLVQRVETRDKPPDCGGHTTLPLDSPTSNISTAAALDIGSRRSLLSASSFGFALLGRSQALDGTYRTGTPIPLQQPRARYRSASFVSLLQIVVSDPPPRTTLTLRRYTSTAHAVHRYASVIHSPREPRVTSHRRNDSTTDHKSGYVRKTTAAMETAMCRRR